MKRLLWLRSSASRAGPSSKQMASTRKTTIAKKGVDPE